MHSASARSAERALEQEPMVVNATMTRIGWCDALDALECSDVVPFEPCVF